MPRAPTSPGCTPRRPGSPRRRPGTARAAPPTRAALLRTAEAAYRGGEVGVLELIDGYRAALDADLSLVELEWAARRARIDLDRTSGGASR